MPLILQYVSNWLPDGIVCAYYGTVFLYFDYITLTAVSAGNEFKRPPKNQTIFFRNHFNMVVKQNAVTWAKFELEKGYIHQNRSEC